MITNIICRRKRPYRYLKVNAIVEPPWHDNACKDSDQMERDESDDDWTFCEEREHITLFEAVKWATELPYKVTLYLYDENDGLYDDMGNGMPRTWIPIELSNYQHFLATGNWEDASFYRRAFPRGSVKRRRSERGWPRPYRGGATIFTSSLIVRA